MADTSDAQLAYAPDPTPNAPLSGAILWKRINFVSHDIVPQSDSVKSKILRPDASVSESRRFSAGLSGNISCELSRDPELEDLIASSLRGAWVSNVLKAGVAKSSLVFEERILEGATPLFYRYRGSVISGFALEAGTDGMVDIRFPITGVDIQDDTAVIATSTYANAGTSPILAGVDFTSLSLSGFATVLDVESLSIDCTLGVRADRKLGSKAPRGIVYGKREVMIELTTYFVSNEAYQKYKADQTTTASFGFTVPGSTAGMDFSFARCRITDYGKPVEGENTTVKVKLQLTATYDATDLTDFKITRRT